MARKTKPDLVVQGILRKNLDALTASSFAELTPLEQLMLTIRMVYEEKLNIEALSALR